MGKRILVSIRGAQKGVLPPFTPGYLPLCKIPKARLINDLLQKNLFAQQYYVNPGPVLVGSLTVNRATIRPKLEVNIRIECTGNIE